MNTRTTTGLKAGLITAGLAAATIATAMLTAPSGATAATRPALVVAPQPNQAPVNDLVPSITLPSGSTVPVHASASDPDITGVNANLPIQVNLTAGTGTLSIDTSAPVLVEPKCFLNTSRRQVSHNINICGSKFAPRVLPGGVILVLGTGWHDRSMTLYGYPIALDEALASLTYTAPDLGPGTDLITMTTNDLGNTGTGGALTAISHTLVNIDPPVTTAAPLSPTNLTANPVAVVGCKISVTGALDPSYARQVVVTFSTTGGKVLQLSTLLTNLAGKYSVISMPLPCNTTINVKSAVAPSTDAAGAVSGPVEVLVH